MIDGVQRFLENLGMLKYCDIFYARGFDLESDIPCISLSDLENSLMIESSEDRAVIYAHAQKFMPSTEYALFEWLHRHSLDHYFINFIQSEITDLNTVAGIQLPNEDLYDELEIVLPGHKKRLERAVARLRQEGGKNIPAETPVTQGWWGKPDCLPQAKFDFLCVNANIFAANEPANKASIDFMVDSGSDVSTVQEKTLEGLNLDLIGQIYSCGIHGGSYTKLYKAKLEVGGEHLDIEVMASNYDSLGSRIVRHFRHVIDGKRHIWLKGNYKDPLPAILPLAVSTKPSVDVAIHTHDLKPIDSLPSLTKLASSSTSSMASSSSSLSELVPKVKSNTKDNKTDSHHQNILTSPQPELERKLSHSQNVIHDTLSVRSGELKTSPSSHQNDTTTVKNSTPTTNGFISSSSLSTSEENTPTNAIDIPLRDTSKMISFSNSDCSKSEAQYQNNVSCNNNIHRQHQSPTGERDTPFQNEKDKREDQNIDVVCNLNVNLDSNMKLNWSSNKRCSELPVDDDLPNKMQKLDSTDDTIPQSLKDTGDDIDNINPFVIEGTIPTRNYSSGLASNKPNQTSASSGVRNYLPGLRHEVTKRHQSHGDINVMDSNFEKPAQEEVVHILSQSDDDDEEEEYILQEDKMDVKRLKLMSQSSNFMPGHGISVMIPMDDLEDDELSLS